MENSKKEIKVWANVTYDECIFKPGLYEEREIIKPHKNENIVDSFRNVVRTVEMIENIYGKVTINRVVVLVDGIKAKGEKMVRNCIDRLTKMYITTQDNMYYGPESRENVQARRREEIISDYEDRIISEMAEMKQKSLADEKKTPVSNKPKR